MKSMSAMRKNEQGMASILITMIMIIVITLIVIGFAQVTRRNQREAIDSQLSTQAYYAAESGVNAAANYLSTNPGYGTNTMGNCTTFINTLGGSGALSGANNNTQYTCLMVDPNPTSLNLSPVNVNQATVLHLKDKNGLGFQQLNFQWNEQKNTDFPDSNPTNNCSSATGSTLPEYASWKCSYGVLRLDLVDGTGANISNAQLQNDQTVTSLYLIPTYSGGTNTASMSSSPAYQPIDTSGGLGATCDPTPADPTTDGTCPVRVIHAHCTVAGGCSMRLDIAKGATATSGQPEYYARLSMMYQGTQSLTITAKDSSQPLGNVQFIGGQAVVDSTGQSEDELRRIQVRVPLSSGPSSPTFGLQTSDSICKRLTIVTTTPGSTATDNCTDR
jgi:Tfp pilus assembly protein PilX